MHPLRSHALLVTVFGAALFLGAFELSDPEFLSRGVESPDAYLDPELNVADLSAELHPDRALTLYYRAYQAALCDDPAVDPESVCARRGPPEPGEVRELFERSLATGNRSIELALYNYALLLLQEGAPQGEIEAAVRRWRLTYPRSDRPDPRELYREMRAGTQRASLRPEGRIR